jgi:hypothetical protein
VYVPQALFPGSTIGIGIEGMHICCELFFIEQMYQLSTMKLDRIDQENSVVNTGNDWSAGIW